MQFIWIHFFEIRFTSQTAINQSNAQTKNCGRHRPVTSWPIVSFRPKQNDWLAYLSVYLPTRIPAHTLSLLGTEAFHKARGMVDATDTTSMFHTFYGAVWTSYHCVPWCWPCPRCTDLLWGTPSRWSHRGQGSWPGRCQRPPAACRLWCCTAGSWSSGCGGGRGGEDETWIKGREAFTVHCCRPVCYRLGYSELGARTRATQTVWLIGWFDLCIYIYVYWKAVYAVQS